MSRTKTGRKFGQKKRISPDQEMARRVALALRKDFGKMTSAVKQIAQITMANVDTATNWYQGKNTPGARYLLRLAGSSPSVLRIVLTEIGGDDLWEVFQLSLRHSKGATSRGRRRGAPLAKRHYRVSDTTNVTGTDVLNERQKWLLEKIRAGVNPKAKEVAVVWNVSVRTAFRDLILMERILSSPAS